MIFRFISGLLAGFKFNQISEQKKAEEIKKFMNSYVTPKPKLGTLLMPKPHYRYNWKTQQAERVKR